MHYSTAGLVAILVACQGRDDAIEYNFAAAISQYLQQYGDLCLGYAQWPIEVPLSGSDRLALAQRQQDRQLKALESHGLVRSTVSGLLNGMGARRFVLSDLAGRYARLGSGADGPEAARDLCWGQKRLAEIKRWERAPWRGGNLPAVSVVYTYRIANMADWAREPAIQDAFGELARVFDGERLREERALLQLTESGWQVLP